MESLLNRVLATDRWEPGVVDHILSTARRAHERNELKDLIRELAPRLESEAAPAPARFLDALARALSGEVAGAARIGSMLESLNQRGEWEMLARLAIGVAELNGEIDVIRYVVRSGEAGGLDALPEGVLDRALELDPENHRLIWLHALALESAGRDGEAARSFAAALAGFAHARDLDRIDDGVLRLAERPEPELWRPLWAALDDLARQGETRTLLAFLEMSIDSLERGGLVEPVWETIRRLLASGETTRKIRALIPRITALRFANLRSIDQVVEKSGIATKGDSRKALAEFDRLLRYAPGLLVTHTGFGPGTIVDNDGDAVTIDFEGKTAHQMSLEIAERSLDILQPDDLETYILSEPDRMKLMARKDPVGLMALALVKLGGEAQGAGVRKHLVPRIISAGSWPAWWKRATAAAKDDPRIDTTQTFRRTYRIQDDESTSALLPAISEKGDLHAAIEMILSFIDQHPESETEARRVYRPRLAGWVGSSDKPQDRAHALLVLDRWDPTQRDAFHRALVELVSQGGDFGFSTRGAEQLELLAAAREAGLGAEASLAAFPCRNPETRRAAARAILEELGEDARRSVRELYSRSPRHEARILGLVEFSLEEPDALPAAIEDPWFAARAVIAIVHGAAKEPPRRQAQALLKPGGKLAALLQGRRIDEEGRHLLLSQLTQWRTTDRHLFPIFDFLESAGGETIVADVRRHRSERSAELVMKTKAAAEAGTGLLMTRAGIERLDGEIRRIELELRTTIPETILRARELGDLRENAEYHAAKEKQRNHNVRLREFQQRLAAARAIEDLRVRPGLAAPGTEVRVRDLDDTSVHTYWILGDGDSFHGADVISYRAPLGAALVGHRSGEEVSVVLEGRERRLEVLSVEAKLPERG